MNKNTADKIKIAITGKRGRMSNELLKGALFTGDMEFVDIDGKDVKDWGHIDAIIDFTSPRKSVQNAMIAARLGCAIVIGTTGFTEEQEEQIARAGETARVIMSGNTSIAANLMIYLAGAASRVLGKGFTKVIHETHHTDKKDSPSGTAIMLREAMTFPNGGWVGVESTRGGDVVGTHTVSFIGQGETLSITHTATDRQIFVRGALQAARWACAQSKPGIYSMRDVVNFARVEE